MPSKACAKNPRENGTVPEPEIELPVNCPCCGQQSLSDFRVTVVAEALQTNQMRLYAKCHITGWEASQAELERIRDHLETVWAAGWQTVCQQLSFA
jgi:hypothetical protein